jgi:hypothetical protein
VEQIYGPKSPILQRIHEYFRAQAEALDERDRSRVAELPTLEQAARLVNAAFWASLNHVEGRPSILSLAFLQRERARRPLEFGTPLPVDPTVLAGLAPTVERPGIHLCAWPDANGRLLVWGIARRVPLMCFVVEIAGPGVLVVKHRRAAKYRKFANVAVLAGDEPKLIAPSEGACADCTSVLTELFGGIGDPTIDATNVFVQLAVSMRSHGRGGALLVVPDGTSEWRDSIAHPLPYSSTLPWAGLVDAAKLATPGKLPRREWTALTRQTDLVGGLTAVDGAAVMTDRFELLGFGAKIVRRRGRPTIESVLVSEPVVGNRVEQVHPSALGGTRHLSAAQFVCDQPGALAMVASQDGRFTVFERASADGLVHAHRIDALLL